MPCYIVRNDTGLDFNKTNMNNKKKKNYKKAFNAMFNNPLKQLKKLTIIKKNENNY